MPSTPARHDRRRGALSRTATLFSAAALGLGLTACTGAGEPQDSPAPGTTAPSPDDSPTPEQPDAPTDPPAPSDDDQAIFDGSRQVDVLTYGDLWVTTTVEGGLTTVDDRDASELPTTWVIEPATGDGADDDARHLLRSTATVDGRDMCLNAPGDGALGLAECDASAPSQQLDIGSTDRPDDVNISTADGYLLAEPDGGLSLAPDPASPGTVFSLEDQGAA